MNKKIITVVVLAALIPAVVYAASPLFFNRTINEEIPVAKTGTSTETQNVVAMVSGNFVGVGDGILEDFKATNGPDLYVYLATDEKATDYVSLGPLKANIGNQNYQIPEGTDLSKYDTALVWCKQFSVLFGHASLS
ncbi:MAG: hypothetical protein HW420_1595 [Candidatus Nitrosotenuis sp.]|nr:hypothetical protein [Candidatus Nitrosotenuis sp.]